MQRPVGVTILAVLALIGGGFALLGALGSFASGAMMSAVTQNPEAQAAMQSAMQNAVQSGQMTAEQAAQAGAITQGVVKTGALSGLIMVLGVVLLLQGILSLAFGVGALQLKPWAWTLGLVTQGIGIISTLWQATSRGFGVGTLLWLVIAGVVIWYLMTPEVRRAFGKDNTALA